MVTPRSGTAVCRMFTAISRGRTACHVFTVTSWRMSSTLLKPDLRFQSDYGPKGDLVLNGDISATPTSELNHMKANKQGFMIASHLSVWIRP